MSEEKEKNTSQLKGLNLLISKPAPAPPDPEKCIICQKKGKKSDPLHSGETGRKRVREVAELKDDIVHKRLKALELDCAFKYHNTYACYKQYTDIRNLTSMSKEPEVPDETTILPEETHNPSTRSSCAPRPGPSTNVNPIYIDCAICGSDRVRVKGKRVRKKFRICNQESALKFLNAMRSKKDDVFVRCADLNTPENIFAADIYCHTTCFMQYTYMSKQSEGNPNPPQAVYNLKHDLFMEALSHLDPLIKDGYGFTVTEIKDFMLSLAEDDDVEIYNRDVKKFILDHYGDEIRFCPSHRANEPEMCFSGEISIEDITAKMRDMNVVKSCGEILREAFMKVDFKISDKFCDGHELKESWETTQMPDQLLTFFASLFGIKRSRMLKIEMINMTLDDNDDVADDDTSPEENTQDIEWAVFNQHNQLNCLFQIMYYQMFHGARKTPLHTSFGHYQYGKCRSREILTVANRIGVSSSYNDVRRSRCLLAAYAVEKSSGHEIPIPSNFTRDSFTIGAMDNADFNDKSSISGMESDHVTMQVLFQETISPPSSKPPLSEMYLQKSKVCLPDKLPCQVVPYHPKPTIKPVLPLNFKVLEELNTTDVIDPISALNKADKQEFIISFIRCGLPKNDMESGTVPTWSGSHALISTSTVPLMRVGFLPMIPSPVTDYATVRKALQNFQSVRHQLNLSQSAIPVFCDEGVFHTVADILMAEPDTFADIHGMMGMFHWVKVLLKCAGRYLRGSGIEDSLIETEIYGKLTLNSVLEGTHYVRSFQGILIVSDVITSLMWEAFWLWLAKNQHEIDHDAMACAEKLRVALCEKSKINSTVKFTELLAQSDHIQELFNSFLKECDSKSEVCQYWGVFQQMALIIKHIISSDREGNFALHIASVERSLPIFRESDCLNYLRYGSFYLETTKMLQINHPEVFRRFMCGHFVVKDCHGCFNAVAPDMKLEQSIQRSSKSKGGIVGQTRNTAVVVEWQLIFHEILLISNNLREMTNDSSMDHSESAKIHHDLIGQKAEHLNKNVARLLDFVSNKGNPFIIEVPGVKLHNFVTKQVADEEVSMRLLQALENGDHYYKQFRNERFLMKTKKLSATISKRNMPQLDYKSPSKTPVSNVAISQNVIATAQRHIDIMKERGMSLELIFSHDILPSSIIFEGDLPSKPDKSKLIAEIEQHLAHEDMIFPYGDAAVILDFMSKIRSFPNLSSFGTFANAIRCVLSAGQFQCSRTSLHVVFDSYLESSVKGGERTRRAAGIGAVDMAHIGPDVPIPKQMDKFWLSPRNKTDLQSLTRVLATEQQGKLLIILSGCIVDDELVPAELIQMDRSTEKSLLSANIDVLMGSVEEADDRLVLHCAWEVARGCQRLLVISNDTDTIVRLMRFITEWREQGLHELWVEFGSGEHKRYLPLHILHQRLGMGLSQVLVKVHVLTGDDALSKIGTKHAALTCEPEKYLNTFAESHDLSEESLKKAEEYLVRVWNGSGRKTSSQTFDQLRVENHVKSATPKSLAQLPPTSSVIRCHIQRSFYIVHNVINLLNKCGPVLDPTSHGWFCDDSTLLPVKGLNPPPPEKLILCKCVGKCDTKRCPCAKARLVCTLFCHMSQESRCQNK